MMLTTAQLRAAHDALHRLIAHGENGDTDYTDADAHAVYDKVCAELRKRDRRRGDNKPGQPRRDPPVCTKCHQPIVEGECACPGGCP